MVRLQEEQTLIGLLIGIGAYSFLVDQKPARPRSKKHYHFAIGPTYNDLQVNGVAQIVHVGVRRGKESGITYISTTGLLQKETGQTAEVLFVSTDAKQKSHDPATEAEIQALVKKHGGNVGPTNTTDGIYAVPNGLSFSCSKCFSLIPVGASK